MLRGLAVKAQRTDLRDFPQGQGGEFPVQIDHQLAKLTRSTRRGFWGRYVRWSGKEAKHARFIKVLDLA